MIEPRRDWRERVGAGLFRLLRPLVGRGIRAGLAGPNVLLTVKGRTSGRPRTTPVAILELDGRQYIQASFGEVNWVRNLRAAGEAVITRGRHAQRVRATELPPEVAGALLHEALAPLHRSRLLRALLGPTVRPPAAVMHLYRFRIDQTADEYVAEARRHPLFELRLQPMPVLITTRIKPENARRPP